MSETDEVRRTVLRAAEADPREAQPILGVSGFSHPTLAIGVEERRHRTVVIPGWSGSAVRTARPPASVNPGGCYHPARDHSQGSGVGDPR